MQTPTPTPIRHGHAGGTPPGGRMDGTLVERTVVLPRWLDAWLCAEHAACEAAGSLATERYFLSWLLDDGFVHSTAPPSSARRRARRARGVRRCPERGLVAEDQPNMRSAATSGVRLGVAVVCCARSVPVADPCCPPGGARCPPTPTTGEGPSKP